jgi:spermidine synthase
MVEIDAGVIEFCRQYLPNHHAGAYDDPRFKLVIDDGVNFVNTASFNSVADKFDVIISDCTDPEGPGESLFTSEFYAGCARCLNEGGIFVAQNGVCFLQQDEAITSHQKLAPYFTDNSFYQAAIPTYYGGIMTFAWATQNPALRKVPLETLQQRFDYTAITCRYYTPAIHMGSFALPRYLQERLQNSLSENS